MINKSKKLLETKIDIANMGYKIDNNNLIKVLELIYGKMAREKRLFISIKKT